MAPLDNVEITIRFRKGAEGGIPQLATVVEEVSSSGAHGIEFPPTSDSSHLPRRDNFKRGKANLSMNKTNSSQPGYR